MQLLLTVNTNTFPVYFTFVHVLIINVALKITYSSNYENVALPFLYQNFVPVLNIMIRLIIEKQIPFSLFQYYFTQFWCHFNTPFTHTFHLVDYPERGNRGLEGDPAPKVIFRLPSFPLLCEQASRIFSNSCEGSLFNSSTAHVFLILVARLMTMMIKKR